MKINLPKNRSPLWSIALVTILATASIFARSGQSVIAQQINCDRPQGDVEARTCIRFRYEASDKRLNEVYKQLVAKLSPEERSILAEAQLGWIQLRDKTCEFEVYKNRGGTGYGGFLNECLDRMTKARTAELEQYLKER
ncbi:MULTISPECIES: lysozyme inhibitor LprI family protein [unclassified Microcoleus]|uniref:lysozyme inhibitor LprI family protein n=1 Tax=unclassified Microcoleus TaxID=2642155 RepID=UPI002FD54BFC